MSDPLLDRIKAHRSAPDVYDPPTFDQMADRIRHLEDALKSVTSLMSQKVQSSIQWWPIRH
jgi:hypothetical protein